MEETKTGKININTYEYDSEFLLRHYKYCVPLLLSNMVVTFPTTHAEISPLKAWAFQNTAPHSNKEKSNDKNELEKKERREHCSKIELELPAQKEEGK